MEGLVLKSCDHAAADQLEHEAPRGGAGIEMISMRSFEKSGHEAPRGGAGIEISCSAPAAR